MDAIKGIEGDQSALYHPMTPASRQKEPPRFLQISFMLLHAKTRKDYSSLKKLIILTHGDSESNPGPNLSKVIPCHDPTDFTICTNNVRGIQDFNKHKRINKFLHSLPFKNNAVICLQETHFKADNRLKFL